jgi:hypothetical protein
MKMKMQIKKSAFFNKINKNIALFHSNVISIRLRGPHHIVGGVLVVLQ